MSNSLQPHGLAAHQASLPITSSRSLLKLTSIESVMPSNHLILCRPLLLPPSIFSSIRVFANESALRIRCLARRNTDMRIWVAPRCPLLLSACTLSPPSHEQHWPLIHVPNERLFNFMCAFINLIIKYFKLRKRFLGSRDEMNKTRFLLGFPWWLRR